MTSRLICIDGAAKGREIALRHDKVRRIAIKSGERSGSLVFAYDEGIWLFRNESPLETRIDGDIISSCTISDGSIIACGASVFEAQIDDSIDDAPTERVDSDEFDAPPVLVEQTEAAEETDSGRLIPPGGFNGRSSRRLSASRIAVVTAGEEHRRKGLLGKVFGRRREAIKRLEQLEDERRNLLIEAGRLALEQQGGIGLPDGYLAALSGGQRVTIGLQQVERPMLEHFRHQRQQLTFLDAEIEGARVDLGLGLELNHSLRQPTLHSEFQKHEEGAFQAMDEMNTEDLQVDMTDGEDDDHESYDFQTQLDSGSQLDGALTNPHPRQPEANSRSSGRRRPQRRRK